MVQLMRCHAVTCRLSKATTCSTFHAARHQEMTCVVQMWLQRCLHCLAARAPDHQPCLSHISCRHRYKTLWPTETLLICVTLRHFGACPDTSCFALYRYTLEQVLLPDKPLLVPGCTADEAIAAVVAANAALPQPHPLCIKSDDSDFWQLEWHGRHSSRSSCSTCSAMEQQQQQADADASEDDERQDSQSDHDQQQQDTEISDDLDRDRHQQQQQQWLFQCGIKWALCCSADTMPRHHLHKCALLGKGREDLLQCGTAFGAVPAGLTLEDAAGTPVQGQARPGDAAYLRQCAAFDDAVRGEAAWSLQLPELLAWLHQFRHQVQFLLGLQVYATKPCASVKMRAAIKLLVLPAHGEDACQHCYMHSRAHARTAGHPP